MTTPKPQKPKSDSILRSRIFLILLVVAMVAFTIWVSGPVPDKNADLTATATPIPVTLDAGTQAVTPVVDIIEKTPTTGVIYGVIAVVLILLIGVWISIRLNKN